MHEYSFVANSSKVIYEALDLKTPLFIITISTCTILYNVRKIVFLKGMFLRQVHVIFVYFESLLYRQRKSIFWL